MDKPQAAPADKHLKKKTPSHCELHQAQTLKYYCSDSSCHTLLCMLCLKQHPKEHIPTITTLEDVKSQAFATLRKEALSRFDKALEGILKSSKMNTLFKDTLNALVQQNTTVELDEEDMADIIADSLQRKYFEKGITVTEMIQENLSIKLSSSKLLSFDYNLDAPDWTDEDHDGSARDFCKKSSEFYSREELWPSHVQSKGRIFFWNIKEQILFCQETSSSGRQSQKYKIPSSFSSFTVLKSANSLLFVAASKEKLIVYVIEEEKEEKDQKGIKSHKAQEKKPEETAKDNKKKNTNSNNNNAKDLPSLKICKEFSHVKIAFLESDNINHLIIVTTKQTTVTATIYKLKNLELDKVASFQLPEVPTKVKFDRKNHLLFILYEDILEVYKHNIQMAPRLLTLIGQIQDFCWHQLTKRLLLVGPGKLYQFNKGRFQLIRVINKALKAVEITSQKILCIQENIGLFLLSQRNPSKQKSLDLPSIKPEMDRFQEESLERIYDRGCDDCDPNIDPLQTSYKKFQVLIESANHLVIYAKINYNQSGAQKIQYDYYKDFGGKIYTQRLLKYNISQEDYQVVDDKDDKHQKNKPIRR